MYVGVLRATFDDQGKIIHESGEPVLLDSSIPQGKKRRIVHVISLIFDYKMHPIKSVCIMN